MGVLAAAAGLFLVLFLMDSAQSAAHQLWIIPLLAALVATVIALAAWHHRRMAELHELHLVTVGRWQNVNRFTPWPKFCQDCGQHAHSWKEARPHDDPDTSPCARYLAYREELERAPEGLPMQGWTADIVDSGGRQGDGAKQ